MTGDILLVLSVVLLLPFIGLCMIIGFAIFMDWFDR